MLGVGVEVARRGWGPVDGSHAGVMVAAMNTTSTVEVPTAPYEAADWLRARHQWVDQLAGRIAGDAEDRLDELAGAVPTTWITRGPGGTMSGGTASRWMRAPTWPGWTPARRTQLEGPRLR